jgi:DNA-binding response OmpR family regulator
MAANGACFLRWPDAVWGREGLPDHAPRAARGCPMPATILVVDDEVYIADMIADVLEDEGYRVICAHDGARALEQIQQDGFDLLITDNMLPHINGVGLIAYMHDHPKVETPVILMSAVRQVETPPGVGFLPKPFEIERLSGLVDQLLPTPAADPGQAAAP